MKKMVNILGLTLLIILAVQLYVNIRLNPSNERNVDKMHLGVVSKDAIRFTSDLIGYPMDKYDGKKIRIVGYCMFEEYDMDDIYFSKFTNQEKQTYLPIKYDYKALGISRGEIKEKFNGRIIVVEGTYNKEADGEWSWNPGMIEDVSRIDSWEIIPIFEGLLFDILSLFI